MTHGNKMHIGLILAMKDLMLTIPLLYHIV